MEGRVWSVNEEDEEISKLLKWKEEAVEAGKEEEGDEAEEEGRQMAVEAKAVARAG